MVVGDGERRHVAVLLDYFASARRRSSNTYEPRSFDLETGAPTGQRKLVAVSGFSPSPYKLYRPVGAFVWGHHPKTGIQLLDLRTTAVVLDEAQLRARVPDLRGPFRLLSEETINDYSAPTHVLRLQLHDGRTRWLDMAGKLHVQPPPRRALAAGLLLRSRQRRARVLPATPLLRLRARARLERLRASLRARSATGPASK